MTNKLFIFLTVIIAFISPLKSTALTTAEIQAKMDEIKLNETFIYGEDFRDEENLAYQNALSELVNYANEIRVEKGLQMLSIGDLQTKVKDLKYTKDGRHTVLVYLPLQEMLSMVIKSHNDVVSQANVSSSTTPATNPSSEKIYKDSSEEKDGYVFVPNRQPSAHNTDTDPHLRTEVLDALASQDNWLEIRGLLIQFKQDGKIKKTGNVNTQVDVPDDAYSIFLDELGGILAILSPKSSTDRFNYKTNLRYDGSNFTDCKFIVWYK